MDNKPNNRTKLLIMNLPVIISVPMIIMLGESAFLLALPVIIGMVLSFRIVKQLDMKDAIAYPFMQYAFVLLLLYFLWVYSNVGLALIVVLPMIFIVNNVIVFLYFRFVKKKALWSKIFVLLVTLLLTSVMYSEHYGANHNIPAFFRMLNGDFGNSSWTQEHVSLDDMQLSDDGLFEFQTRRIQRNTPLSSNSELWIFIRNLTTGEEVDIRLDEVMDETEVPRASVSRSGWATLQPIDENQQSILLTTTSNFYLQRRWVFELNTANQTAELLEQIHVGAALRVDDYFRSHLYMVNFFDENRSIRLVMIDLKTDEIIQISIDIDVNEVVINGFNQDWDFLSPVVRNRDGEIIEPAKWVIGIEPTDVPRVYTVVLREGLLINERVFELDMNTSTIHELNSSRLD